MQAPTHTDLLDAWERGVSASEAQRALLLLETLGQEAGGPLAAMPLGWVHKRLLELRATLLGPTLTCLANCRECDTILECRLEIKQLTAMAKTIDAAGAPLEISHANCRIEYRLPTCADLLALEGDPRGAALTLAGRLVRRATCSGEPVSVSELPPEWNTALEEAVLENDPLAGLELALDCPACGLRWTEALPVIDFVWSEFSTLAERLVYDVARLAFAFGWRESDILSMTDHRRRRYLELLPA